MTTYTSKIVCVRCGKFYKRKNERGKFKWVCQGYDNFSICKRIIIDEEGMTEFISRRLYPQDRTEENIQNLIKSVSKIEIKDKYDFTVYMINGESMYRNGNHTHY